MLTVTGFGVVCREDRAAWELISGPHDQRERAIARLNEERQAHRKSAVFWRRRGHATPRREFRLVRIMLVEVKA